MRKYFDLELILSGFHLRFVCQDFFLQMSGFFYEIAFYEILTVLSGFLYTVNYISFLEFQGLKDTISTNNEFGPQCIKSLVYGPF